MASGKKVRKLSGLKEDGSPNAHWLKFKQRLDDYEQVPVNNWKAEQVLGHILKRYRDVVGTDFKLSYSGAPSKCQEMYCMNRMILSLGTNEGATIKKYIDWVYEEYIIRQKLNISSIAFFFTDNFILRFKAELRKSQKITRTTPLPERYINLAVGMDISVNTYGDLAFAWQAIQYDPDNEDHATYTNFFNKLMLDGFDVEVFNRMEA